MTSQPFAIPELIFFVIAVPLVLGLVPRNRFYGVRTRKTLSDDRIWYPVNRLASAVLMIGSALYGIIAVLVPYNRAASDNFGTFGVHLTAFVLPLVIALGLARCYAKRFWNEEICKSPWPMVAKKKKNRRRTKNNSLADSDFRLPSSVFSKEPENAAREA
jgi:uncharacterized membrane protein YbhN (UPF0104 family)